MKRPEAQRRTLNTEPISIEDFLRQMAAETDELERRVRELRTHIRLRLFALQEAGQEPDSRLRRAIEEEELGYPGAIPADKYVHQIREKQRLL